MEQVIVTGAAGFVGRHLVRRLEREGASVTAVVGPRHASDRGQLALDVRDVDAMRDVIEGAAPTVVFHLAGTATRQAAEGPAGFEVNGQGTAAVVEAVHRAGCPARVVVASTDALTDHAPVDAYERSKADAEAVASCAMAEQGVESVVARLANVYGPGDPSPHRLVPAAARAAVAGTDFQPATPSSVLDLVHVEDAVTALVQLGRGADGSPRRIASNTHVTVRSVVEVVQAIARGEAPPPLDVSPYESSVPLVAGWTPRIALGPGLEATVRWYLERSPDQGAD